MRIGLGYTVVVLENDQTGVALTFHERMKGGCSVFEGFHPLAGRGADELIGFLDSSDNTEMAVALATVNALANTSKAGLTKGDVLEHVQIFPEDVVGMVGYFGPMIPRLEEKTSSIMIFEQRERAKVRLLPGGEALRLLPRCQVAIITSTAILNHTIDDLLHASRSCREVILLGASTPLIPEVFAGTAASTLSGVIVTHPEEILRIVSEGGGMQLFKRNVEKVNLSLKSSPSS